MHPEFKFYAFTPEPKSREREGILKLYRAEDEYGLVKRENTSSSFQKLHAHVQVNADVLSPVIGVQDSVCLHLQHPSV